MEKELQQEMELVVYPNPASNMVRLHYPGIQSFHLSVYNVFGALILQGVYMDDVALDVSVLQSGIYFFRMESTDKHFEGKFEVLH
jgi:hypothetical protein